MHKHEKQQARGHHHIGGVQHRLHKQDQAEEHVNGVIFLITSHQVRHAERQEQGREHNAELPAVAFHVKELWVMREVPRTQHQHQGHEFDDALFGESFGKTGGGFGNDQTR